jgi:hypothetical protein
VYGAAMGLATKLGEVLTGVFAALPFAPGVRAAVLSSAIALGTLEGTAIGGAIAAALAAAPFVIPVAIAWVIQENLPPAARRAENQINDDFLHKSFLDVLNDRLFHKGATLAQGSATTSPTHLRRQRSRVSRLCSARFRVSQREEQTMPETPSRRRGTRRHPRSGRQSASSRGRSKTTSPA